MVTVWVGVADGNGHDDKFKKKPIVRAVTGVEDFSGYAGTWARKDVGSPNFWLKTPEEEKFICKWCLTHCIKKWVDTRRQTFLALYGELLEKDRIKERIAPLTLEEYRKRHKDNEAAAVPHLPNECPACSLWVTVLHDCKKCAAKLLAAQRFAALLLVKRREAKERLRRAVLVSQGIWNWQSDQHDLDIVAERKKCSVTADTVKQFDRDFSRKGNKYRIQ
jgi:hypothetical protein